MYPRRLGGNALLQFAMEVGLTPPIILVPQDSFVLSPGIWTSFGKPKERARVGHQRHPTPREIIPERGRHHLETWARSSRNDGRLDPDSASMSLACPPGGASPQDQKRTYSSVFMSCLEPTGVME